MVHKESSYQLNHLNLHSPVKNDLQGGIYTSDLLLLERSHCTGEEWVQRDYVQEPFVISWKYWEICYYSNWCPKKYLYSVAEIVLDDKITLDYVIVVKCLCYGQTHLL